MKNIKKYYEKKKKREARVVVPTTTRWLKYMDKIYGQFSEIFGVNIHNDQ